MSSKATFETLPLNSPTPNNFSQGTYIGIIATMFSFFFAMNVIFPFVPFMVHDFFPHASSKDLGYFVGYIDSAFFTGSVIAAIVWSNLSDIYGRKPILLTGLSGSIFTTILFGLSLNYPMALVTRFVWGSLDGNITVCKTILGEISNKHNQSKLYTVIGVLVGLGRLTGNMIGGWLVLFHPIERFKYFMPCLVSGLFAFVAVMTVWCYLEETLEKKKKVKNAKTDYVTIQAEEPNTPRDQQNKMWAVWKISEVRTSVFYSGTLGFLNTSFLATVPLWLLLSVNANGFDYKPHNIGTIFAISGPIFLVLQLSLFPKLIAIFGYMNLTKLCGLLSGIMLILLPHLSALNVYSIVISMLVLTVYISILYTLVSMTFTVSQTMVNNCCDAGKRATVNGFAQMMINIGRFIAPIIMCNFFSFTVNSESIYWINYCFVFYLQGIISILSVLYLQVMLPRNFEDYISLKKKIHLKHNQKGSKTDYKTFESQISNETDSGNYSVVSPII